MKNLLLLLLSTCCLSVAAQNFQSDTLSWNVAGLTDNRAHIVEDYDCEFLTFGSSKIVWIQRHQTEEFSITGSSGVWQDLTKDGAMVHQFQYYGKPAKLSFIRSHGIARIHMEVMEDGSNVMPYVFDVTLIQKK